MVTLLLSLCWTPAYLDIPPKRGLCVLSIIHESTLSFQHPSGIIIKYLNLILPLLANRSMSHFDLPWFNVENLGVHWLRKHLFPDSASKGAELGMDRPVGDYQLIPTATY